MTLRLNNARALLLSLLLLLLLCMLLLLLEVGQHGAVVLQGSCEWFRCPHAHDAAEGCWPAMRAGWCTHEQEVEEVGSICRVVRVLQELPQRVQEGGVDEHL